VSATGHGEFFIRAAVAHEIAALMRYKGLDVIAGGRRDVVMRQLVRWAARGRDRRGSRRAYRHAVQFRRHAARAMDSSGRLVTGLLRD
jgi:hypothetical protein